LLCQKQLKKQPLKTLQLLFIVISFHSFGQQIHHQTYAAQGAIVSLPSVGLIKQTIGQQSVIGNYVGDNIFVGQGFLQGNFAKKSISLTSIEVLAYPNPFVSSINFQFSAAITTPIDIKLYDVVGRVVYAAKTSIENNILSIDNLALPDGSYIISLKAQNLNYTTSLIKSK
jgi:hypothetical protein